MSPTLETQITFDAYRIFHWLNLTPEDLLGKRTLDLGCGDCCLARAMEGTGANIISMDLRYEAIAPHHSISGRLNAHAKLMPIKSESIDILISIGSAPTNATKEETVLQTMAEIVRVLAPGGKALLSANLGLGLFQENYNIPPEQDVRIRYRSKWNEVRRVSTEYLHAKGYPVTLHQRPSIYQNDGLLFYWSLTKPQQQAL
jgi:SAM-dependent methyltransferase